MINIAICDDDDTQRNILKSKLEKCCEIHNWNFIINDFPNGETLLKNYTYQKYNIIFLDIYMNKLSGIDTAKLIRNIDLNVILIFVTITPDFSFDGFQVGALHYLLKPVTDESINNVLFRCEKQLSNFTKCVKLDNPNINISIRIILFIEVFNKDCIIHTFSGIIKITSSIASLISKIDDCNFIRCHRSYYVNLLNADSITTNNFIIMKNKEKVPISIRKKKDVVSLMDKLLFERVWEQ